MLTFSSLPWFTLLFKRPYAYSLGKTVDGLQNDAAIFMVGPAVCSMIITLTTAVFVQALGISTYGEAVAFALLIAINPNMPRPLLYALISGAFHLTGIILVALILITLS